DRRLGGGVSGAGPTRPRPPAGVFLWPVGGAIMSDLHGRVAIVTGASRGIGRAIALGLAKAGCAVVIAAKSTTESEKLPGSIHTVAAEVEALGGQALPVQVDVRHEE